MSLLKRIENGQTTSSGAGNGKDSGSQLGKIKSRSAPAGGVSTQRDTYSGLGRFPSSQWQPGDRFVESIQVHLPETAPAPEHLAVRVGFYAPGSFRLAVFAADDALLGDSLLLGAGLPLAAGPPRRLGPAGPCDAVLPHALAARCRPVRRFEAFLVFIERWYTAGVGCGGSARAGKCQVRLGGQTTEFLRPRAE